MKKFTVKLYLTVSTSILMLIDHIMNLKEKYREGREEIDTWLEERDKKIRETCKKQIIDELKILKMRFFNNQSLIKKEIKDYLEVLKQENEKLIALHKKNVRKGGFIYLTGG